MTQLPSVDVAVVGGGLVGSSVAYELACAGASVALIDGSLPGRASDAGAGIISPETFHKPDGQWTDFAHDAGQYLRALVTRVVDDGAEVGPDAFSQCGSLVLALAEHEDPWFSEVLAAIQGRQPDITEIPVDDARAMFPPLGRLWRALYSPSSARADGRALTRAVRLAAESREVTWVSMEVTGVDRRGDRVTAVRGVDDVVPCGELVWAGGAWSGDAASWFGVPISVTPTKGQIVHVILPETDDSGDLPQSDRWPIVQPILNFYLVPWPGGRVACGGTFEPEAGFDVRPTAGGLRDLLRECLSIAPGLPARRCPRSGSGSAPPPRTTGPCWAPCRAWPTSISARATAPTACCSARTRPRWWQLASSAPHLMR